MYPTRWNIDKKERKERRKRRRRRRRKKKGEGKRKKEKRQNCTALCVERPTVFVFARTVPHARGTRFMRRRFHGEISLKWGWSIADCLDGSFERVRALFNERHHVESHQRNKLVAALKANFRKLVQSHKSPHRITLVRTYFIRRFDRS